MMEHAREKFGVGALLYTPALNAKIAQDVLSGRFGSQYSLSLCLEDTVAPEMVEQAEHQAVASLETLSQAATQGQQVRLPKIFIRVREPEQIPRLFSMLGPHHDILTGFTAPKYTVSNAAAYNRSIQEVNGRASHTLYLMPILESADLVSVGSRRELLLEIASYIQSVQDLVLNVRVGGTDFCNQLAVRRHAYETIYDILPVAQILGDILSVFSRDYVVSGPVWEYFSGAGNAWKTGLQREMRLDRLNGFVGKTVIHPNQIPVVNQMLKVPRKDYEDAKAVMQWGNGGLLVQKSAAGERMNEARTHARWAEKMLLLADIYGVLEDGMGGTETETGRETGAGSQR